MLNNCEGLASLSCALGRMKKRGRRKSTFAAIPLKFVNSRRFKFNSSQDRCRQLITGSRVP